jgi:lipopolysaccharide transport system ATP-binding protein
MREPAIKAEGLGKRYLLGENTSRDRLQQALHAVAPRWLLPKMRDIWAVRDVSFTIGQGEAIGIIGRNGAGKSTLLKLLSRVTKPTAGHARIRGRIGTLLEVGTGFHPELTGRDNIFLSGTILGMTYAEVARKFDEIVAFSEIGEFIDTPVKRYSSGMYVRLAFAVASFLEPEILIVDEVLAVGDAAFQRKSLGRLNEAAHEHGRTVLFVSHNLQAIRTFCSRVLLIEQGRLVFDGPTQEGIERYLRAIPKNVDVSNVRLKDRLNRTSGAVRFSNVVCSGAAGKVEWQVHAGGTAKLSFDYEAMEAVPSLTFVIRLTSAANGELLTMIREVISAEPVAKGYKGTIDLTFPDLPLRPGEVSLYVALGRVDNQIWYDVIDENVDLPFLKVVSDSNDRFVRDGIVSLPYRIESRSFENA